MQAKNLRTEAHVELKQANIAFTECFTNSFLPRWLKGEKLQVSEVCGSQLEEMQEKDDAVYGETPMPIRPLTLPQ